jgi:hypothetical protein
VPANENAGLEGFWSSRRREMDRERFPKHSVMNRRGSSIQRGFEMARKYSPSASKSVERAMRKRKEGTLKSGKGGKVKSRKQAIAIGLSEARKAGKKVPRKKAKT